MESLSVLVVVNSIDDLKSTQTTTLLISGLLGRGHRVAVCNVDGFELAPESLFCHARTGASAPTPMAVLDILWNRSTTRQAIGTFDTVLLRTNPGRDPHLESAHSSMLDFARIAKEAGATVLNDPDGLSRASNKLYLRHVPARYRPRTLVTGRRDMLLDFIREAPGPTVIKPLSGTRGDDVFKVTPETVNLNAIVEVLRRQGHVMAQDFVPEAVYGDTRVVLVDGEALILDGHALAVARVPPADDFRSNVAKGGCAQPATLTPEMREVVASLGPQLRTDGLFLVGLDFIGAKVVEVNVFSPGGFDDAERFYGLPFTAAVIKRLEFRMGTPPSV